MLQVDPPVALVEIFVHVHQHHVPPVVAAVVDQPGQQRILVDRAHGNDQRRAAALGPGSDDDGQHFAGHPPGDVLQVAGHADRDRRSAAEPVGRYVEVFRQRGGHSCTPIDTCLVSRNASNPSLPSSRPQPLCLTPPKGHWLVVGTESLMPIMPDSSDSASRHTRETSRVKA